MERETILVVEDDELVSTFLCRALSDIVDDVHACATGAEAMRLVERGPWSVILLDGLLPDTHGIDVARRMLGHPNAAGSGICFVSGTLRWSQPTRAGVAALPKPLRVRELTDEVRRLLAWHRGQGAPHEERAAAVDLLAAELLVG